MRRQAVAAAGGVEESGELQRLAARGGLEGVTGLVLQRSRVDLVALGRTHPTSGGEHDGDRLVGDQRSLVDGLGGLALDDLRSARIAVSFGIGGQLGADQFAQHRFAAEHRPQLVALGGELCLLAPDLHLFELGEVAQLGLEDGIRLDLAQRETLHQHRLRLILTTDDADHLVEVEEGREQAVEDVQPTLDLVEPPLEAAPYRGDAELQPLREDVAQPHDPRPTIKADHIEVDAVVTLEIGGGEQVRHQLLDIDLAAFGDDDESGRVLVVGLIAQVFDHRQFLGAHLLGDLLEDLGAGGLPRQRPDDDAIVLDAVGGPGAETAGALVVDRRDLGARRDDLGPGG